jgi:hypothetical protein
MLGIKMQRKKYIPAEPVSFNVIGDMEFSTVKLPFFEFVSPDFPYETCVFYGNGESHVAGSYVTLDDAIEGHNAIIKTYLIKEYAPM